MNNADSGFTDMNDFRRTEQAFRDHLSKLADNAPIPDFDQMMAGVLAPGDVVTPVSPFEGEPDASRREGLAPAPSTTVRTVRATRNPSHWKRWTAIGLAAAAALTAIIVVPFATGIVQFRTPAVPVPLGTPISAPPLTKEQLDGRPAVGDPNVRMYDFAELTQHFYYCDPCTINEIVKVFGEPRKMEGDLEEHRQSDQVLVPTVTLTYPAMTMRLAGSSALSFATQRNIDAQATSPNRGLTFPVSSKDRTVSLSILGMTTTDPAASLPRDLQIGVSTQAHVLAAYPLDDPPNLPTYVVSYLYVWFDDDARPNGGPTYEFDDNHVLSAVEVTWDDSVG